MEVVINKTKGNIVVEDIEIGDIHYEFGYGCCCKSKVITKPELNEDGNWVWKSENVNTGVTINYLVNPEYTHYLSCLYDYEAYANCIYI